jgi:hypothetical protein
MGVRSVFLLLTVFVLVASSASAISPYDDARAEYPAKGYLLGIGEAEKTGKEFVDKRVAEVLARAEIARQIKVRLKEETVDIACEGPRGEVVGGSSECKNMFLMVIEQSVNEVLVGSRIVRNGAHGGVVYAVAVLPRASAAKELETEIERLIDEASESIKRARGGDAEALKEAKKGYVKALALDKEKDIIKGGNAVKSRASNLLEELEKEVARLGEAE